MVAPSDEELQHVAVVIRRVALGRGMTSDAAEDVAQETLGRLLVALPRLTPDARLPFALTTAGNLIVDAFRRTQRDKKHQHRLLERDESGPEADYLAAEESAAVRVALGQLSHSDRQLVIDHSDGSSMLELAAASQSTPSAVAARLARTRARLRLDYLLALRRVSLPDSECRRVLLAISAADTRRQRALDAAGHLSRCRTCTDLIPPLAERRSRLAGIAVAPLVALGTLGGRLHHAATSHAVQAAAATTAVAAGAVIAVAATRPPPTQPMSSSPAIPAANQPATRQAAPSPEPTDAPRGIVLTSGGIDLLPLPGTPVLRSLVGQRVLVSDMAVQSVASHPGFWIGTGSQRLYVHITDPAAVRTPVRVGQRVSFAAALLVNPPGYAGADGVDPGEGAGQLGQQGVHLNVTSSELVIAP